MSESKQMTDRPRAGRRLTERQQYLRSRIGEHFAQRVKMTLRFKGWTQVQLSRKLGLARRAAPSHLHQGFCPSLLRLYRWADVMDAPVHELLPTLREYRQWLRRVEGVG